jgi:hypothetical protein
VILIGQGSQDQEIGPAANNLLHDLVRFETLLGQRNDKTSLRARNIGFCRSRVMRRVRIPEKIGIGIKTAFHSRVGAEHGLRDPAQRHIPGLRGERSPGAIGGRSILVLLFQFANRRVDRFIGFRQYYAVRAANSLKIRATLNAATDTAATNVNSSCKTSLFWTKRFIAAALANRRPRWPGRNVHRRSCLRQILQGFHEFIGAFRVLIGRDHIFTVVCAQGKLIEVTSPLGKRSRSRILGLLEKIVRLLRPEINPL